jgi:hypothetical protein
LGVVPVKYQPAPVKFLLSLLITETHSMLMFKKIVFFAMFLLPVFTLTAQQVTVYADCNYTGQRNTLSAGRYSGFQMGIGNDRLSSVQVAYGMKITIYEHEYYQGRSRTYTASNACLEAEWRNAASSFVIEADNTQPVYNQNDYVTFFNDCYQRGANQVLRPGRYTGAQLGTLKNNISSFTINGGSLRVKLYINNEDASGYSNDYDASVYCLPASLNDKTLSLVIEYKPGYGNTGNTGNNSNERYATFYSACDYQGNALRLMPGTYSGTKLGLMKNSIQSVQVPSGMRVRAYTGSDNMFGSSTYLTQDISCLDYNLNNKIASLVVEDQGGIYNPPAVTEPVIIYADDNYRGQQASLLPGNYSTMAAAGGFPDNAISSLKVPDGYRVVLYEFENFTGKTLTVTSSRTGFLFTSWNDKTSSVAVYKDR